MVMTLNAYRFPIVLSSFVRHITGIKNKKVQYYMHIFFIMQDNFIVKITLFQLERNLIQLEWRDQRLKQKLLNDSFHNLLLQQHR
ncbi:hypothetical protein GFV14_00736 [Candidatus Hartigia pinicola]|nr:hypothetical protein GFV14_00736 [Candidatus Hartigia pinicola]